MKTYKEILDLIKNWTGNSTPLDTLKGFGKYVLPVLASSVVSYNLGSNINAEKTIKIAGSDFRKEGNFIVDEIGNHYLPQTEEEKANPFSVETVVVFSKEGDVVDTKEKVSISGKKWTLERITKEAKTEK